VADFVSKELGSMSGSVKGFFADFRGGIDALAADVASARKTILRGTGVLSAEEIASQIAGAAITAPGTAGVAAAAGNVAEKSAAVAAAKAASDAAAEQAKAALAAWTTARDDPQSAAAKLAAAQQRKQHALSEAGKFEDGGELRDRSYSTRVYWMNYWYPKAAEAQREIDALQPALQASGLPNKPGPCFPATGAWMPWSLSCACCARKTRPRHWRSSASKSRSIGC
jgi:hypothetical protein